MSDVGGRLSRSDLKQHEHPSVPKEACVIMHTGKNYDGWWTCEDLFKQVRDRAIPIFEAQYPTSKVLFAFDNAASHAAFATDALVGKRMNLGSGGKQPKMRNGRMKDGTVHPMCFPETHPDVTLRDERAIELKCYPFESCFNPSISSRFVIRIESAFS